MQLECLIYIYIYVSRIEILKYTEQILICFTGNFCSYLSMTSFKIYFCRPFEMCVTMNSVLDLFEIYINPYCYLKVQRVMSMCKGYALFKPNISSFFITKFVKRALMLLSTGFKSQNKYTRKFICKKIPCLILFTK